MSSRYRSLFCFVAMVRRLSPLFWQPCCGYGSTHFWRIGLRSLLTSWPSCSPLGTVGDPNLLRVALENLLGNAWKFTGKHDKARIEFGVKDQDGQRVYFVRDDGAGFDMKSAAKLFGVFQRMHWAADFAGTGIGLATVARIIRAHGGKVWADAEVARGATFFFTLPVQGPENEE